jgi:hypothetical protein
VLASVSRDLERVTKPSQDSQATLTHGAPQLTSGLPTIRGRVVVRMELPSAALLRIVVARPGERRTFEMKPTSQA